MGKRAGRGDKALTVDIDSSICETYGSKKERARFGYTSVRGPQPAPGDSRRQRGSTGRAPKKGSAHTARGAAIFLAEVFNRVRATGASGELTLWADSGFHNHKVIKACQKAGVHYSITAKLYGPMSNAIEAVPPERWAPVPYWAQGGADVAKLTYPPFGQDEEVRFIVRRVKPSPGSQLALFATYEYHPFITDREGPMLHLEADHRRHAEIELAIRDLKEGPWAHIPRGASAPTPHGWPSGRSPATWPAGAASSEN